MWVAEALFYQQGTQNPESSRNLRATRSVLPIGWNQGLRSSEGFRRFRLVNRK